MSWNLSFIRTYADSVVHHAGQAVVGGAMLIHNSIGSRNIQSFQQTVKRLETQSVSARGNERVLMLRRWLKLLKQAEAYNRGLAISEESRETMVFYQDSDQRGEPVTFLVVFLHSEALEGIALSMIHEEPNDEEAALILEIFGHCLMGAKDIHVSVLSSIRDLAGVFLCYRDEVLMKREELLQFAQSSISGLKISAEQSRLDTEIISLKIELMKEIKIPACEAHDNSSEEVGAARTRALQEALLRVRHYSKLKALLLQRKDLHHGDSPEAHAQKLDKLKILTQSLAHSSSQAHKMLEEERCRREEALNFREAKVNEVNQGEKDLLASIEKLQQRKDELEAELKKVNSSLATANARLNFSREEKMHFDKASIEMLSVLQSKEHELLRSISLSKTDTEVASAWISFIESTWSFQCDITKQNKEFINTELGRQAQLFESILIQILPHYKNELLISIEHFKEVVRKLQDMSDASSSSRRDEALRSANRREKLEAEFHDVEGKVQSAFSVVETIKQLLAQSREFYRKDNQNVDNLIDDLQMLKDEFESIDRPDLKVETPTTTRWKQITKKLASKETRERLDILELKQPQKQKQQQQAEMVDDQNKKKEPAPVIDGRELLDSDDEDLVTYESEFVTDDKSRTSHDLNDWEV